MHPSPFLAIPLARPCAAVNFLIDHPMGGVDIESESNWIAARAAGAAPGRLANYLCRALALAADGASADVDSESADYSNCLICSIQAQGPARSAQDLT